jgi:hypothetical protein
MLLFLAASGLSAQTYDPKLSALMEKIPATSAAGKHPLLLVEVEVSNQQYRRLAQELTDECARVLRESNPGVSVLESGSAGALLEKERLGPEVLQNAEVARWFAERHGVRGIVTGVISPGIDGILLSVRLFNVDGKTLGQGEQLLDWSEERRQWAQQRPREVAANPRETARRCTPGSADASQPKCKYCPVISATADARAAHFQGDGFLGVLIEPDGSVRVVRVMRPLPFGLATEAVKTVRYWKFEPPRDAHNKPCSMELIVEVNFHVM